MLEELRMGVWREISNITAFYIFGSCEELGLTTGFLLSSWSEDQGSMSHIFCLSR